MNTIYEPSTICAQATASGQGAIAIVRMSGSKSFEIISQILKNSKGESFSKPLDRRARFGTIVAQDERIIDEVVAIGFAGPNSYTGEDSVEIYCHGSDYIVSEILKLLISCGAQMASAGEFTKRAFLNGRLDLAQAEAVADLIASETSAAHDVALKQIKGGYSDELRGMRDELVNIVSLMELELDFSEEDVEFADRTQLKDLLSKVIAHIETLIDSFSLGNVIKNGVPTAIIGATNTGKSTLLNGLLREERAIVSDIAGTTRDTIEDTINIDGVTFRFIDTAGIRSTKETIEIIGIERTFSTINKASVVLMVLDATRAEYFEESLATLSPRLNQQQELFIILNKLDVAFGQGEETSFEDLCKIEKSEPVKAMVDNIAQLAQKYNCPPTQIITISAKQRFGIEKINKALIDSHKSLKSVKSSGNGQMVTNLRHYQALKEARESLQRVEEGIAASLSTEFISQDIRQALYHIGTITGEVTSDEILGNIFRRFCIGK